MFTMRYELNLQILLRFIGEEKNQLDATSTDVYSQLVNSQHVRESLCPSSGEVCIKLRAVFAWLCCLRSCGAGTRAVRTV